MARSLGAVARAAVVLLPECGDIDDALIQGVPAKAIAERLGHSSVNLTLNTYSHLSAEMRRQTAAEMESVLSPQRRASP